ncbi:ParB/RepB/Spo0J family partition protein [Weissella koreensis]|uniref:ParB/RepB/Spo0J family partition protein n=1 Tax=Weissella koreensis TaxID=165096 RepID=A0A7H1MLQ1_9LACO|nr:ParB/RepB/Spo0J family partition protein [Weissella koreensis]AVH75183.1 ParB/RepB/Spo0J family partition protein [Weissella koreensis]EJF33597.1 stage 0 DNA-binding protein [Weissella koreensis KCTC 3621]QGN20408.1 ParB/RepB/Spo0J family partition protein [Weissella koreensis]QNT64387.1 ParB/RepB/Spo0J family partition protein [Weissella koreensis]
MTTSKKKSVLGDNIVSGGLNALFGQQGIDVDVDENKGDAIENLNVNFIIANPFQPRHSFDENALRELANSIKENGILQPIIVRVAKESKDKYEILAGERRWRATQLAGNETIPAVVRAYDDATMMQAAVLENLQRENLSPIEEALAYKQMMDVLHLTQVQVAKRLGKARSVVANTVRLLTLPQEVQDWIQTGELSMGQGRTLLGLHNKRQILNLAKRVMQERLTVRQVERLVNEMNENKVVSKATPQISAELKETEKALSDKLATKIAIKHNQRGAGKIEINYGSDQDLNRIINALGLDLND